MTKASEQQLTQDGETRSLKVATRRSSESDSSDIRAILNLLGPTTTDSDVIEMDPVRLKKLNDAAMIQKN